MGASGSFRAASGAAIYLAVNPLLAAPSRRPQSSLRGLQPLSPTAYRHESIDLQLKQHLELLLILRIKSPHKLVNTSYFRPLETLIFKPTQSTSLLDIPSFSMPLSFSEGHGFAALSISRKS